MCLCAYETKDYEGKERFVSGILCSEDQLIAFLLDLLIKITEVLKSQLTHLVNFLYLAGPFPFSPLCQIQK